MPVISASLVVSGRLILFTRMRFPKALSLISKKRRAHEQAVDIARNRLFTRAACVIQV
jgi:hypothetical protein